MFLEKNETCLGLSYTYSWTKSNTSDTTLVKLEELWFSFLLHHELVWPRNKIKTDNYTSLKSGIILHLVIRLVVNPLDNVRYR